MCGFNRCGPPRQQLGVPLDDETFLMMDSEEVQFWQDLLGQAQREIKREEEESGQTSHIVPSVSLRAKYQKALAQYNGAQYCQVRQLEQIFIFPIS
jgi:hypothetical protein